jgi:hypothetical protein
MHVVMPLRPVGVPPPVFVPVYGEFASEDSGFDEGADVYADAVVYVGVVADGLLGGLSKPTVRLSYNLFWR